MIKINILVLCGVYYYKNVLKPKTKRAETKKDLQTKPVPNGPV